MKLRRNNSVGKAKIRLAPDLAEEYRIPELPVGLQFNASTAG
jgi:hypothetical protein